VVNALVLDKRPLPFLNIQVIHFFVLEVLIAEGQADVKSRDYPFNPSSTDICPLERKQWNKALSAQ
jgi:hypothetical protein